MIMDMLRSTTFVNGTTQINHIIDLAFTEIPSMGNVKFMHDGDPDIDFDDIAGIFTNKEQLVVRLVPWREIVDPPGWATPRLVRRDTALDQHGDPVRCGW